MSEIVFKLKDALGMFWLALDDKERRLVLIGVGYLFVTFAWAVSSTAEEKRQARIVSAVADEMEARRGR